VVHVGYHRTATTWLQTVAFVSHPEIASVLGDSSFGQVASDPFLAQVVFARDTEFDASTARAHLDARIAALGADPSQVLVVSAERLSGNAASGGFDAARIADRLRAAAPDARIVVVLRHQSEAIVSEYKEIVRAGWPGNRAQTLSPIPPIKTVGFALAYWEYDRLLDVYAAAFGRANVCVLDYGRFARDRSGVLGELATFLGVAPWVLTPAQLESRVNAGERDRATHMRQRMNHFRRTELNPYPPIDLPDRLGAMAARLAGLVPGGRPLFGPDFERWVDERYADTNQRLADEWGVVLTRSPTSRRRSPRS
jgi:hypothetical protein